MSEDFAACPFCVRQRCCFKLPTPRFAQPCTPNAMLPRMTCSTPACLPADLSSGNIMLRSEPRCSCGRQAKVCDFGLSRFLEGPEQSHISNARQGTPFYVSAADAHEPLLPACFCCTGHRLNLAGCLAGAA